MFDDIDDAELISAIAQTTRAEAASAAARSAMIGELLSRRLPDPDDPRHKWVFDPWDSVAAEVAAAMGVSPRRASGQMRIAEALRDHLPKVFALAEQGRLSARVIAAITWRTRFILSDDVWARIDTAFAERAEKWGPLSDDRLNGMIDALVENHDPDALVDARTRIKNRDFTISDYDDESGIASVWGKLLAHDAAVFRQRVSAITATVCADDPRSAAELRSDAAGAIANGNDYLVCRCGSPQCPNADRRAPASHVVISVVADQTAVDAATAINAEPPTPHKAACRAPVSGVGTAVLSGAVLPTPMLAELLRNGAKLAPLPAPSCEPEPHYRPSAKLARWIRARDVTCRFPGCTAPAEYCDIDHVVPYPIGPTHGANMACLCRKHHQMKTFWVGDWALRLLADGTAIWTAPTGHTYTTYPGCRILFPDWDTTSSELRLPDHTPTADPRRCTKAPTRRRSRAADRDAYIKAQRAQNNSVRTRPPNDPDPPSF